MTLFQTFSEYLTIARLQREMAQFFPGFHQQKEWLDKLRTVDVHVKSAHNSSHILKFLLALLKLSPTVPGVIVEAGAYKGGGTCKISLFKNM
jgi:hypothetical protein